MGTCYTAAVLLQRAKKTRPASLFDVSTIFRLSRSRRTSRMLRSLLAGTKSRLFSLSHPCASEASRPRRSFRPPIGGTCYTKINFHQEYIGQVYGANSHFRERCRWGRSSPSSSSATCDAGRLEITALCSADFGSSSFQTIFLGPEFDTGSSACYPKKLFIFFKFK